MPGKANIEVDGDYYKEQLGGKPGFLVTYEVVKSDNDSGEPDDRGYDDYHSCEPDEFDLADGKTPVSLAIEFLNGKCVEFSGNDWWTDADGDQDYRTGDETRHSYHATNFTDEQMIEISKGVN
jgi:hypothetical protein